MVLILEISTKIFVEVKNTNKMILIIKYSINKISLYMCGMFAKVSKCTGVTYPEKNIIKIIVEVTFIYLVSNAKSFLLP